jgi:selenide,water dikinase
MAVIGLADPGRIVTNAAARPGDVLFLTKPLGVGITTTGIKRGMTGEDATKRVVDLMAHLNRAACEALLAAGVTAATDVTGFGLLGHLHKMLNASGAAAEVWADAVPLLEGTRALVAAGAVSGGTRRNMSFVEPAVDVADGVTEEDRIILADAQTSGGLLIACPDDRIGVLRDELSSRGEPAAEVGRVVGGDAGRIAVMPSRT